MIGLSRTLASGRVSLPLIERPWARVRTPVPIKAAVTAQEMSQLRQEELAQLVRSNFVPRAEVPGGRAAWEQLWLALGSDEALTSRVFDALEDFLDEVEQALDAGELDDAEAARARKFKTRCEEAWQRLNRVDDDTALAWAGKAGEFQPAARRVIAILIGAIARHRSAVVRSQKPVSTADRQLWDAMGQVNLDPADYQHRSR